MEHNFKWLRVKSPVQGPNSSNILIVVYVCAFAQSPLPGVNKPPDCISG